MSTMDRRRLERFRGDGPSPIVLGEVRQKIAVLEFVKKQVPQELSQLLTLQSQEFKLGTNYLTAWSAAQKIYQDRKNNPGNYPQLCEGSHPGEYHIALIAYTIENPNLYSDFNKRTREIKTLQDFQAYPYKSYFSFLLLAVKNIYGNPKYMHETQTLYRGVSGKVDDAVVGNSVVFQHFVSTTRSKEVAEYFSEQGKTSVLFVIKGVRAGEMCTGMDDHSVMKQEQEILVWPYEGYTISKVDRSPNRIEIHLVP